MAAPLVDAIQRIRNTPRWPDPDGTIASLLWACLAGEYRWPEWVVSLERPSVLHFSHWRAVPGNPDMMQLCVRPGGPVSVEIDVRELEAAGDGWLDLVGERLEQLTGDVSRGSVQGS